MPKIICVVGPTASGKTALAVNLAKELDGEVISFDSMQIYRGMDIGTAKPTKEEMDGVVHHMLDVADPKEAFSVGKYTQMADPILQDVLSRGKTAVLVGGTGLYADALISGREFAPVPSTGIREALEKRADTEGTEVLLRELSAFDPDTAGRLHPKDRKRIIRATEIYMETGKTMTQHDAETRAIPPKYTAAWLGLTYSDRAMLYSRIDKRVDMMLEMGLLQEIQRLAAEGLEQSSTALAAIGYKEFLPVLQGQCSVEEAAENVKLNSRHYAKRQLTWFRRREETFWLDRSILTDDALLEKARQYLRDFDKGQ